jgi:uncharacterized membrane protein YkvA (DUF1232 family)
MPWWLWLAAGALLVYLVAIAALMIAGRRTHARALAGFIPDCIVLVHRLLRDPRVPRWRKVVLALVLAYLLMPIDLVPDFIPVAGQLDDAILVALALRGLGGLVREHWPGPMSIWGDPVRVEGETPSSQGGQTR